MRIEQRMVGQRHYGTDILAENGEDLCCAGNYTRIVGDDLQGPACEIDGLAARCRRIFRPAIIDELHMAGHRKGKRRPIMPIDGDRVLEQSESFENSLFRHGMEDQKRPEIAS